jgi:putative membrane protein
MFLSRKEAEALDARASSIEASRGARVSTAVIGKADSYPELPWKAFALAVTLAAFALVLADALKPQWVSAGAALLHSFAILAAGIAAAAAAIVFPPFARIFLRRTRRDVEVHQYAQSLFLRLALFDAPGRRGVLILVSMFERKIEILPDSGLDDVMRKRDWNRVVGRMTPLLVQGKPAAALEAGLAATDELLEERGVSASGSPAALHSNKPVDERGA